MSTATGTGDGLEPPRRRGRLANLAQAFNQNKLSWIGLGLFAVLALMAFAAPLITPFDPIDQSVLRRMKPPSAEFWFGTDQYGRDLFSRAVYGARISLLVGTLSVALGMLIGEIVRKHEIRVDQAQVQQRLQQIGESYGDAEAVIKIYRSNPDLMSQLETSVMEEQVVEWLLERAKITEKPIKFSELMNQEQA